MSKRKADGSTVSRVVEGTPGGEVSWPGATSSPKLQPTPAAGIGQVSSEGVLNCHLGPSPATSEGEGVHDDPGKGPAGTTEPVTVQVEAEGNATAEAFWELLKVVGYTVWG